MKKYICAALLLAASIAHAAPAYTNAWDVDLPRNPHTIIDVWRGESIALTARTGLAGLPDDAEFRWQTPDMGDLFWVTNAAVNAAGDVTVEWLPEMDSGSTTYFFFFRGGGIYRPRGTIRMQGSPGAEPNTLPMPSRTLDFATITVTNAPWTTPADIDAAIGNIPPVVETDPVASAQYQYDILGYTPTPTRADAFVVNATGRVIIGYNEALGGAYVVVPWMINGIMIDGISGRAFKDSSVVDVVLPRSVKYLGVEVFANTKLNRIVMPEVEKIDERCFHGCNRLTYVDAPKVIEVEKDAFQWCRDLTITLPKVRGIKQGAFSYISVACTLIFTGDAPTLGAGVYTASANVTNIVTNPTATGWGDTFGGQPVVRPSGSFDSLTVNGEAVLTDEHDPVFSGSPAAAISYEDIVNLSNLSGTNSGDQDLSGYARLDSANTFAKDQTYTAFLKIKGTAADRHLITRGIGGADTEATKADDLYINFGQPYGVKVGSTGQFHVDGSGNLTTSGDVSVRDFVASGSVTVPDLTAASGPNIAANKKYVDDKATMSSSWINRSGLTGSVAFIADGPRPQAWQGTGDLVVDNFTGLVASPVYWTLQGFDSVTLPAGIYAVGGGSWQVGRANHFLVWQVGTKQFINFVTASEIE